MSLETDFQSHLRVAFFWVAHSCRMSATSARWQDRVLTSLAPSMIDAILKLIHLLSIIVWVGGMVFAHFFLRPAVAMLEPPQRLQLMHGVLARFFRVVLVLSSASVLSGLWMIGRVAKTTVQAGGAFHMPLSWTVMATLGLVMWAIFGHIRFSLFRRMGRAVVASEWPAAAAAMARIRLWVSVNLGLGLLTVAVALLVG